MVLPLSALGVLLFSLASSAEIVPQAEFNLQKVSGKWHLIGFASNSEWFISRKARMKMGTAIFTPTLEGDLNLSHASLRSDGSCWRMANLVKKTDVPGQFSYSTNTGDGNNMIVVEVNYDEYALVQVVATKGQPLTVVNKLYGRSQVLRPDLLDRFQRFSLQVGILPENILLLPQNEECPDD